MTPPVYDIFPRPRRFSAMLLAVLSVAIGSIYAQPSSDSDWPCVQRLVPEVSAAVIWPGPLPETLDKRWQEFESIVNLVEQLTSSSASATEAQKLIAEFAESITFDRNKQITLLFTGILETLNARRSNYIETIKRFTRHQNEIAVQVQQLLNELSTLGGKSGEVVEVRRREVEETAHWHQRVFDQREKSIIALCERPVEVEQSLGELARIVAEFLR